MIETNHITKNKWRLNRHVNYGNFWEKGPCSESFLVAPVWTQWIKALHGSSRWGQVDLADVCSQRSQNVDVPNAVADPREAPLICRPIWGPKGRKKIFFRSPPLPLSQDLDEWASPPYLKVWLRHCYDLVYRTQPPTHAGYQSVFFLGGGGGPGCSEVGRTPNRSHERQDCN